MSDPNHKGSSRFDSQHAFCMHCGAFRGQLGLEKDPDSYVEHLVSIFDEVRRVLKKDGVCFVVIGDSYVSGKSRYSSHEHTLSGKSRDDTFSGKPDQYYHAYLKDKDLAMIPARFAIAMQKAGWWLRSKIIWVKALSFCPTYSGSTMPESATDRPTDAYEEVFMFTKSARYFCDEDALKEPSLYKHDPRAGKGHIDYDGKYQGSDGEGQRAFVSINPNGRHLRNVWLINPEPSEIKHYATYPKALVRPCVLIGSRVGDTVIDPFVGVGTTAIVAKRLGRKYIGIDLSQTYIDIAEQRLRQRELFA